MKTFRSGARSPRALSKGLLLAAALVLAPAAVSAQTMPPVVAAKLAEGSDDLSGFWSDGARLPIIVEFAMPPVPDPAGFENPDDADAAHTRAIRAVQDAILLDLLGSPADVANAEASPDTNLKRMSFSPMFGMVATAGDLERLAADPRVVRIHEDGLSKPQLTFRLERLGMPAAYAAGATGAGFHVAILDTGARRSHEFLSRQVVAAACFSTTQDTYYESLCPRGVAESVAIDSANDCDAYTIDGCGHGTHVTGIAAGFNTNYQSGEPINGIARDGRVISINVFSRVAECSGLDARYTNGCVASFDSDQIKGLEHVFSIRNTFRTAAVNLSVARGHNVSSACDSHVLKPIIDLLRAADIATVIPAGNNEHRSSVDRPACISTAVTVAASVGASSLARFSNWGDLVDVVAPGQSIVSSFIGPRFNPNWHYGSMSGTSMAAAQVAGAFAALRSAVPNATVYQIEDALKSTGLDIVAFGVTKSEIRVAHALTALRANTTPANDDFANRINIPRPTTVTGRNFFASAESGEPTHAGQASARNSVWWRYTPSASGQITIHTVGSNFDTVLAVYRGSSVANLTEVASNSDFVGTRSQVTFAGAAGTSYAIAVAGKGNASGSISLTVLTPPSNDNFANRINIPNPSTITGTNIGASAEIGEPIHANLHTARNSVWWRYTPSTDGPITINTFRSSFDTALAVYTGSSVANLTQIAADRFTTSRQAQVTFQGRAGTSYAIAVAGYNNASGAISLTVQRGGPDNTTIVAAVTPVARATQVRSTVTAFATIINSGNEAATACSAAVPTINALNFSYRPRNHVTGALGTVNQLVNIAAGARQDFLMAFTPTSTMQREIALVFDCANTAPAPSVVGLNTFLLIGTSSSPPADLISIAVTPSNDGIMNIPLGGIGFSALAAMNIGASAQIQARLSASSILSTASTLPNTTAMVICRTNPTTGACLATPTATVNFTPGAGEIVTFTAFVASNGTAIPFDPAATRLFVHFFQGTTPVGSASVAARTVPNGDEGPDEAAALAD